MEGVEHNITPLRVDLDRFTMSKSQRRVWRQNEDVHWEVSPAEFDDQMHGMFARHSERFEDNKPTTLHAFFSDEPSAVPCECLAVKAWLEGKMIAVSFMDLGAEAVSSVYAIFEPEYQKRSLGVLTLLQEIRVAQFLGKRWLYQGFGTRLPSRYDYKKRLSSVQGYSWDQKAWNDQTEIPQT